MNKYFTNDNDSSRIEFRIYPEVTLCGRIELKCLWSFALTARDTSKYCRLITCAEGAYLITNHKFTTENLHFRYKGELLAQQTPLALSLSKLP